jgi:hypothetical protein
MVSLPQTNVADARGRQADVWSSVGGPPDDRMVENVREAGDREDRIRQVLGLAAGEPLPSVSEHWLHRYYDYLAARLSFPFGADYGEEIEPLERFTHTVTVVRLLDPREYPGTATSGLLCRALLGRHEVVVRLAEVEVGDRSVNRRLIDDYWYWFWNLGHQSLTRF